MKKFNFVTGILVASAALMAAGCASDSSSGTTPTNTISVANAPAPTGGTTGGTTIVVTPTPTPSNSGSRGGCGVPGSGTRSSYAYTGTASGTGPITSTGSGTSGVSVPLSAQIQTDGTLRVSVTPAASGANTTTGGTQPYAKMAMTVILKKNGAEVARKQIPSNAIETIVTSVGSRTYNAGIATGVASDPLIADFSGAGIQGSGYTVEVANIKTSYICTANMTATNWSAQYNSNTSSSCRTQPNLWGWVYDYTNGYYYNVCQYTLFNTNQTNVCGVGVPTATSSWSMQVQVETDKTYCIQN